MNEKQKDCPENGEYRRFGPNTNTVEPIDPEHGFNSGKTHTGYKHSDSNVGNQTLNGKNNRTAKKPGLIVLSVLSVAVIAVLVIAVLPRITHDTNKVYVLDASDITYVKHLYYEELESIQFKMELMGYTEYIYSDGSLTDAIYYNGYGMSDDVEIDADIQQVVHIRMDANEYWCDETGEIVESMENHYYHTFYDHDDEGRLIREETYDPEGELRFWCTYEYDDLDRIVKSTQQYPPERGFEDYLFMYSYLDSGYHATLSETYQIGELVSTDMYEYDDYGNITASYYNDASSSPTLWYYCEYEYDSQGNCLSCFVYEADGTLVRQTYYSYDERGNVIDSVDSFDGLNSSDIITGEVKLSDNIEPVYIETDVKFQLYNFGNYGYLGHQEDVLTLMESASDTCWWIHDYSDYYDYDYIRSYDQQDYVIDIDNALMADGTYVKVWVETGYKVQSWHFAGAKVDGADVLLIVSDEVDDQGESYCLGYDPAQERFCIRPLDGADYNCFWDIIME